MDSEDPITLGVIGLGLGVVGTGMSATGLYQQGRSQQETYDYNAQVANMNAQAIQKKTEYEEDIARTKLKRLMGTQRALYAKAGVDISSGSPLLVLADTAMEGEKELSAIRYGGSVEEAQTKNQSKLQRFYGNQARSAGTIGAGSSFITGLGQAGLGYASISGGIPKTRVKGF